MSVGADFDRGISEKKIRLFFFPVNLLHTQKVHKNQQGIISKESCATLALQEQAPKGMDMVLSKFQVHFPFICHF